MAARQFSNIAVDTTLSSGIAGGALSLTVVDATGWPAAPFLLVIEPDLGNEELILVGAKAGAVFSSLTRGFGGTSDVGHSAADVIKHVIVGEDLALTYSHVHKPATDFTAAITHADVLTPLADDHHDEAHTVVSHSDTAATGAELDSLTDGSEVTLHNHANENFGLLKAELQTFQAITNDNETTVLFDTIVSEDDPSGDVAYATGTGLLTMNNTGWYIITVNLITDTPKFLMSLHLNGTGKPCAAQAVSNVTTDFLGAGSLVFLAKFTAADNLRVRTYQKSGGLTQVEGATEPSSFAIARLA